MVVHSTLLALLSLALFLSLAAGAAIPYSLQLEYEKPEASVEAASWSPAQSTESGGNEAQAQTQARALAKRAPYYFPETVPDADEIASRLTAMREAGFLAGSQTQQSMGVPDAGIDPRARIFPIRDLMSELSAAEAPTPTPLPPMAFFVFAACAACLATVFRNINCKH
jgi:hypothetical protein